MKTASRYLLLSLLGLALNAQAGPMGPSAKMAARLKKHPTSTWLAHYLPDDRYKIAGRVWKYVSTDLDTYYHRPDSPLMMRQSANRVIGFASTAEAEEAGYKPAPGLAAQTRVLGNKIGAGQYPKLSRSEVRYLQRIDGWMDELSDAMPQLQRHTGNFASLRAVISRAQKTGTQLYKAPIPPRFAKPGRDIRQGVAFFLRNINQLVSGTPGNGTHKKDLDATQLLLARGTAEIIQIVGNKNFSRYVTLKD